MIKLRPYKTAMFLRPFLRLAAASLVFLSTFLTAATARAQSVVIINSSTPTFPAGVDAVKNGDLIMLYTNPTGGGPAGLTPLIDFSTGSTATPTSFSLLSGDGGWYTITNTAVPAANADPTNAIRLLVGSTITLSNITFAGNRTLNANGVAIVFNSDVANDSGTSVITGTAAFINNHSGSPVTTNNNNSLGGAIHNSYGAFVLSGSFLFQDNSADRGGAINTAARPTNSYFIGDILFQSNTANVGGALNFQQYQSSTVFFQGNTTFIDNYAHNGSGNYVFGGGAIATNVSSNNAVSAMWMIFDGSGTTLFQDNRSASYGGAIKFGGQVLSIGGNTSFIGNQAGVQGGAIFQVNSNVGTAGGNAIAGGVSIILDASTGDILFRDNVEGVGSDFSQPGTHNAIDIYSGTFNAANSGSTTLTLNSGTAGDSGNTIYLYDPVTISDPTDLGPNQGIVNVNVIGTGTVLLDTYRSFVNGRIDVRSGIFALTNGAAIEGVGANSAFTLRSAATLHAGGITGGNRVSAPIITFESNAAIILDLQAASRLGAPVLTLNAATALETDNWNQTLTLLNLASLGTPANGETFTLISLTGDGADNSPFSDASFNAFADVGGLLGSFGITTSADGYSLLLYYGTLPLPNSRVLNWNGISNSWTGYSWLAGAGGASFLRGDVVNLAGTPPNTTIDVDTRAGVTVGAMFVSGEQNYTITGNSITGNPAVSGLGTSAAGGGRLVLGAKAGDDGATVDTLAYTGTLTFANTVNNFLGGITINSGALVGNDRTLGSGGAAGTGINNNGLLVFDQAADATYTAPFRGSGSFVKTNTGALTLTANSAAFTGATTIDAGSLLLASGATLGGSKRVSAGAVFGGAGSSTGAVALDGNATLQIGIGPATEQSFNISGNLSIASGASLSFTNVTNSLIVGGNLGLLGTGTIQFDALNIGNYSIISAASGLGSFNTSLLDVSYKGSSLDTTDYLLSVSGNQVWIDILNIPLALNNVLTWTNASGDSQWLVSRNWNTIGITKAFVQNDIVNLAALGDEETATEPPATHAINLGADATLAAMYVSGEESYVLSGEGGITIRNDVGVLAGVTAATGQLVLGKNAVDEDNIELAAFTGTLDLAGLTGVNNFTGGIEINTGALRVSDIDNIGIPNLSLLSITGTGALIVASGATLAFDGADADGANTAANHVAIGASGSGGIISASYIVEPGATLIISHNTAVGDGGVFNVAPLSTLTLSGTGGSLVFDGNTADRGGVIYVTGTGVVTIDNATFLNNKATLAAGKGGAILTEYSGTVIVRDSEFTGNIAGTNGAQGNGGAIAGMNGGIIDVSNVLFTSNTAFGLGGAIFGNTVGARITVKNSTFDSNAAIGNSGGAIAAQSNNNQGPLVDIQNSLFEYNYSTGQGGGLWFSAGITGTVANTTFFSNTAAFGGAIALGGASGTLTLNDVDLIENYGTTYGGAIYLSGNNSRLNINVSPGHTSQITGNLSGTMFGAPTLGTTDNYYNSIYFSNNNNYVISINVGDGGTLITDPMYGYLANNQTTNILKNGAGTWDLAATTVFAPANAAPTAAVVNFIVAEGTLHLYGAREFSYYYTIGNGTTLYVSREAASITNVDPNNADLGTRGLVNFSLRDGATLSAGGGNIIDVTTISIDPNANITLDLSNALTSNTAYSVLRLLASGTSEDASINGNGWTQNLTLLNVDSLLPDEDDTYNLITLGGRGVFLSATTFNLLTELDEGYSLQIADSSRALQLVYSSSFIMNHVVTWTGEVDGTTWYGVKNWDVDGSGTNFHKADIVNLASIDDTPLLSLNVNTRTSATMAAMYVSGSTSYTLTGTSLDTSSAVGYLSGSAAATGKLVLGAIAAADGDSYTVTDFTGTLTLDNSGTNTFEGGIDIFSGNLVGNSRTLGAGEAGIANNGALTFNQTFTDTYDSPISGAGSLAKIGAGTLTFTADSGAFTGVTEITRGALLLAPAAIDPESAASPGRDAALGGAIHVASGATFGGVSTAGSVTLDTGAALQVGLTTQDSGLRLNLTSDLNLSANSQINYTNISDSLHVAGAINQTGTTAINIAQFQNGTYDIGNLGSLYGTVQVNIGTLDGNLAPTFGGLVPGNDARLQAAVTKSGDDLIITAIGESRILTWQGAAGNAWNLADTAWTETGAAAPVNRFISGDRVVFDDSSGAATHNININRANMTVSDMIVQGTSSYTFTGNGITASATSIIDGAVLASGDGLGMLYKAGSGTLTFSGGANNFLGGIEINEGAISFTNGIQLGDGGSGAGILFSGNASLASPGADVTLATNITVVAGITGTIDLGSRNMTFSGEMAALGGQGTIAKFGTGQLTLSGSSAAEGAPDLLINVDEGSIFMGSTGTTGGRFLGTIDLAPGTRLSNNSSYTNTVGAVNASGGSTIQIGAATLRINDLQLADSSTLTTNAASVLATLNGAATLNGTVNVYTPITGAGTALRISGTVLGEGGFLKTGVGEFRLNGVNAMRNTGPSQINEGILGFNGVTTTANTTVRAARRVLDIVDNTITVPGQAVTVGSSTYFTPDLVIPLDYNGVYSYTPTGTMVITPYFILVPSATYFFGGPTVVPSATVTIGGSNVVFDSYTYTPPDSTISFVVPAYTINLTASNAVVPIINTPVPRINTAATVAQNIVLNGGTFNLANSGNTWNASTSPTTALTNDATANNWAGVRVIQGDNAATSAVTGNNDILHVGAGAQVFAIRNGLFVAVDAGPGGVTTLENTANNFTGMILVNSGTLRVSTPDTLGYWGAGNASKIGLAGGDIHFTDSSTIITTRALELRADGIIDVGDEAFIQFGPINKTGDSPTATLTKIGSGTFQSTGVFQATALTVEEGRYIASANNGVPNASGPITVYADAVFQFAGNATTTSDTLGYVAGNMYVLSGNGRNTGPVVGEGTLEITAGRFSYSSPDTTISNIIVSGSNTSIVINGNHPIPFAPNSTLTIDQGMLIFGSGSQNTGNVVFKNGGSLAFLMNGGVSNSAAGVTGTYGTFGEGFKSATIKSLAYASPDEPVSTLWFNTNVGNGWGDHLEILSAVSGTYNIAISNWGKAPVKYAGTIELLKAPGSDDAEFIPLTPQIDIGLFTYLVTATTTADTVSVRITGSGALSRSADFINALASTLPLTWFTEIDSVTQRLGDLRFEQREGAGLASWLRGYGSETNYNSKITGTPFDERQFGAEAGIDAKLATGERHTYLGAFAGYGQTQRVRTASGDSSTDSAFGGVYFTTLAPSGWYVDIVSKLNTFKSRFNACAPTGERTSANFSNWAMGGSLEIGKNCELPYGWLFTPLVQGVATRITGASYATDSGIAVAQRDGTVMRARAGFMFGGNLETGRHGTFNIYIKACYGGQWTSGGAIYALTEGNTRSRLTPDIKGASLEGGAGVSWLFSKGTQVYFDYDTINADQYIKPWGFNLGIRHEW